MGAPSRQRRSGRRNYFVRYSGPASPGRAFVSLYLGFHSPLMEVLLWAKPYAEHVTSISLRFYKKLIVRASEHLFTMEDQRG